jgi:uroporphyrinogen-III synthase
VRAVLNTRPREQAAELSSLLRAAGLEPVELPAIEIVEAWAPGERQRVLAALREGRYDWLVLQSQNAGRAVMPLPPHRAEVCCGASTAHTLGIAATLVLQHFSAATALEALRPLLRGGQRVLVPRAAEGRDELVDGLCALGVEVDAPVCYRTAPVNPESMAALPLLGLDAITLCSPSAARSLVQAVGLEALQSPRIVCLGETTAQAARELGFTVHGVAAKTSMAGLVAAVLDTLEVAV